MAKATETSIAFMRGAHRWASTAEGWVLTKLSGLRGPVEYSPQNYAGSMGSALGGGYAGGVQLSVEVVFGDPDPMLVAEKVSALATVLPHGGPPSVFISIQPMGFESLFRLYAATAGPTIEYSHGGCLATVSIEFYSNDYRLQQFNPGPGEDGKVPW